MKNSYMLIFGIFLLIVFIIYKVYKLIKYSIKVELEIERYSEENTQADRFYHRSVPIYKYSYKGMIYKYNNGNAVKTKKKYIRINPNKPSKAYLPYMTIPYLFFNFIILVIGLAIYIVSNF